MKNKYRLIISTITLSIFILMSVGFAIYGSHLSISGTATFTNNGSVAITNVVLSSSSNIDNPQNPEFTANSINFNLNFTVNNNSELENEYLATYDITITNDSLFDYSFASSTFTPSVETTNNQNLEVTYTVNGITPGEIIPSKGNKTFSVTINMYPKATGEYNVTGGSDVITEQEEQEENYSLIASIPSGITLDLRGSTMADTVVVSVVNTYEESKTFELSSSNSNFNITNSNGQTLSNLTIAANTSDTYTIYVRRKNGVTFPSNTQTLNLHFTPSGGTRTNLGTITILVDKDEHLLDGDAPVISNVSATINNTVGSVDLSWDANDASAIDHFIIEAYDGDGTLVDTFTTTNANTSYTATGLSEGTYYFQVYGVDDNNNNGKTVSTSCSTSAGTCSRSTSASYKWVFNVTNSCSNCTFTGNSTVNRGATYTATVAAGNWYSLPDTITVTMGGQTLATSAYTYRQNNGSISIPNVTGNISISVTANFSCLAKGTKILLANNTYKNIEDITYNDLLAVWSYETGKITYEYPIWIEKAQVASEYRKVTLEDGTVLKIISIHGLFNTDNNMYVNIKDGDFKVGMNVAKIENGNIKQVKVKKIELIKEPIDYYHVVSTRYYNVIANDVLTTDGTVMLSNLYGFNSNITWPSVREPLMNEGLYSYSEFSDIMPYYMFKGLRVEEGKVLERYGLSYDMFKYYLKENQMNEHMLLPVNTNYQGKRLWMVTTSLDKVNELNKNKYLHTEGSLYKLPMINGIKKWYSTSENLYYNPGDTVKVEYGMHFIAVK